MLAVVAGTFAIVIFGGDVNASAAKAKKGGYQWTLPANLPEPRVPANNPMTQPKVTLGRFLFYDARLSGNGKQSCSSCHLQKKAFTDGLPRAIGSTGELHPRSSQTLTNVAYHGVLTWANPGLTRLEKQMEVPLFGDNPVEMGLNDRNKARVLARFRRVRQYRVMFKRAFPNQAQPIGYGNIIRAIASFQRTLISGNSKYDRWLRGAATMTASEQRGMSLFFGERAECHHCHGNFNFTDQVVYKGGPTPEISFHNTGLFNIGGTGAFPEPNRGVFELTGRPDDMGKFRAPTLRNIAVTKPYMHDGSLPTLRSVVDFYAAGGRVIADGPLAGDGRASPLRSDLTVGIDLSEQEKTDLVMFLKTLTDRSFLRAKALSDPFAAQRARARRAAAAKR